jgi:hypothetical protein
MTIAMYSVMRHAINTSKPVSTIVIWYLRNFLSKSKAFSSCVQVLFKVYGIVRGLRLAIDLIRKISPRPVKTIENTGLSQNAEKK